jgi:hypothetical protein
MISRGRPIRDPEALPHPPAEPAQALLPRVPQVGLLQQRVHRFAALAAARDPLQQREVVQHGLGADARVHAELLRQVAQRAAHGLAVCQHVHLAQAHAPGVGLLQRGQDAHERALPRPVGPQQPEQAGGDGERHVLQGRHAVGIRLPEMLDRQVHVPRGERWSGKEDGDRG